MKKLIKKASGGLMAAALVSYMAASGTAYADTNKQQVTSASQQGSALKSSDSATELNSAIGDTLSTPDQNVSFGHNSNMLGLDERTGQLKFSMAMAMNGAGVTLSDSVPDFINGKSVYGAPAGWGFNLPFIARYPDPTYGMLCYFNGAGGVQTLDPFYSSKHSSGDILDFYSGLYGYNFLDQRLKYYPDGKTIQYSNIIQGPVSFTYAYSLQEADGENLYFDKYGKITARSNRYGQYVRYNYCYDFGTALETSISSITDVYGNSIAMTIYNNPDGKSQVMMSSLQGTIEADIDSSSSDKKIKITDINGGVTKVDEQFSYGDHTQTTIESPSGSTDTYYYSQGVIPYYKSDGSTGYFDAVTKLVSTPGENQPSITTLYCYIGDGVHNYTGYGSYSYGKLEAQGNENYTYSVLAVSPDSGLVKVTTYNYLGLPKSVVLKTKGGTKLQETDYYYEGENSDGIIPFGSTTSDYNYNKVKKAVVRLYPDTSSEISQETDYTYDSFGKMTSSVSHLSGNGGTFTSNMTSNTSFTMESIPQNVGVKFIEEPAWQFEFYDSNKNKYTLPSDTLYNRDGDYSGFGDPLSMNTSDSISGRAISANMTYNGNSENCDIKGMGSEYTMNVNKDSIGRVTSSAYTSGNQSKTQYNSYSISNNVLTVSSYTIAGNITTPTVTSEYDLANNWLLKQTNQDGAYTTYSYQRGNGGMSVTANSYDPSGKLQGTVVTQTTPNTSMSTYQNGYKTLTNYDGFGRAVSSYDNITSGGYSGTCSRLLGATSYNALGQVTSTTDFYGHTTTYEYNDPLLRLTGTTDYQGNKISYAYGVEQYNGANVQTTVTSYNGTEVEKVYSGPVGTLESINYPDNTSETFTYDAGGKLYTTCVYDNASASGTPKAQTSYTYGLNTLDSETVTTSDGTSSTSVMAYDYLGNLESTKTTFAGVSPGVYKGSGVITGESYGYDALGRTASMTDQRNRTLSYSYNPDGSIYSTDDYKGDVSTVTYTYINGLKPQTVTISSPEGKMLSQSVITYDTSDISSDSYGNILSETQTNADGSIDTVSYEYYGKGAFSGLLKSITKNGKTMSYTYYAPSAQNASPLVKSVTDYAGVETDYTYYSSEPYGRIQSISNEYGTMTYCYYGKSTDTQAGTAASGNQLLWDGSTVASIKYVSYTNPASDTSVVYEYEGEKSGSSSLILPQIASMTTYNSSLQAVSKTLYDYETSGRLHSRTLSSQTDVSSNANNTDTYTYNDLDELTEERVCDNSGKLISDTNYVHDIYGNLYSKDITNADKSSTDYSYTYNELNQLVDLKVKGSDGSSVSYDMAYDDNGNMTSISKNGGASNYMTMSFNALDQMTSFKNLNSGVSMSYTYGVDGQRKKMFSTDNPSNSIEYFYNGIGLSNELDDASGNMTSYLGSARYIVNPTALNKAISSQSLVSNGKDVTGTIDSSGAISNLTAYTPYGMAVKYDSNSKNTQERENSFSINNNPFGYDGYYQDPGGLDYLNARYYLPEIGQFISQDSYDLSNRYAYCDGNPVGNSDPTGHMSDVSMDHGYFVKDYDFVEHPVQGGPMTASQMNDIRNMNTAMSAMEILGGLLTLNPLLIADGSIGIAADYTTGSVHEKLEDAHFGLSVAAGAQAMVAMPLGGAFASEGEAVGTIAENQNMARTPEEIPLGQVTQGELKVNTSVPESEMPTIKMNKARVFRNYHEEVDIENNYGLVAQKEQPKLLDNVEPYTKKPENISKKVTWDDNFNDIDGEEQQIRNIEFRKNTKSSKAVENLGKYIQSLQEQENVLQQRMAELQSKLNENIQMSDILEKMQFELNENETSNLVNICLEATPEMKSSMLKSFPLIDSHEQFGVEIRALNLQLNLN